MSDFEFIVDMETVNDPPIHSFLVQRYGDDLPRILHGLENGEKDILAKVHDFLSDTIMNESSVVDSIEAATFDDDTFTIQIMNLGLLYWVQDYDFGPFGVFRTLSEARNFARKEFLIYIELLADREKEDSENHSFEM
ncbi:hypothetical protein [Sphaerochaeta sp. PS]|uniref:hypothetical protein n=1 Tax=Sphaerochaeta sp. PS TaxID=3076336 RepID=UPI0028A338E3|nr:hypothetical protein [Sphaerochaeta sp. PS]MDT4761151.1 hypothetical protein [Sphaerochaeta sp. PS]